MNDGDDSVRLPDVPLSVRKAIVFLLGSEEAGLTWLADAERTAIELSKDWGVRPLTVLAGGAMSLCVLGLGPSGTPVVLKIPTNAASGNWERAAHQHFSEPISPKILANHEPTGAFLMEFIDGPTGAHPPSDVMHLTRTLMAAGIGVGAPFPSLRKNLEMRMGWAHERFTLSNDAGRLQLLEEARQLCTSLLESSEQVGLLHGDLQGKNMLSNERGLVVIDPLPVIGDVSFDLGFWIAMGPHTSGTRAQVADALDVQSTDRAFAWAWAISVIEDRPYLEADSLGRGLFIDQGRSALTHWLQ